VRVLLFGASGGIGSRVRAQARAAGHELVLFARDPARLEPLDSGERVVAGDIAEPSAVAAAVAGVDAVVSALGPADNTSGQVTLYESFATALVEAMEANGVRRLVAISGAAVTLPGERKALRGRIASAFVRLLVPHVVRAKQREIEIISAADLDWIAPRPPRVIEGGQTDGYRLGDDARAMRVSQGDLAHFMVSALTDDRHLRQAPFISS